MPVAYGDWLGLPPESALPILSQYVQEQKAILGDAGVVSTASHSRDITEAQRQLQKLKDELHSLGVRVLRRSSTSVTRPRYH